MNPTSKKVREGYSLEIVISICTKRKQCPESVLASTDWGSAGETLILSIYGNTHDRDLFNIISAKEITKRSNCTKHVKFSNMTSV